MVDPFDPVQAKQAGGGAVVLRTVHGRPAGSDRLALPSGASAGRRPACARGHRPGPQPHRQPQGKKNGTNQNRAANEVMAICLSGK